MLQPMQSNNALSFYAEKAPPNGFWKATSKSCFDGISHQWLLTHVPTENPILRQWLKAGYIELDKWHETESGTPQGGVVSPVLMNMTLDGLEVELKAKFPSHRGQKVHLVRFADDFIVTGSNPELLEQEIKPLIEQIPAGSWASTLTRENPHHPYQRGRSISSDKTYANMTKTTH